MNTTRLWIVLATLAAAALACNAVTGAFNKTPQPDGVQSVPSQSADDNGSGSTNGNSSEYPAPDDASNFVDSGGGTVNFQTSMSLKDVMEFYRDSFGKQGYKERTLLTTSDTTTFSMVFDGHASGKSIVVQGVDLGGSTNVSIRLEAVQ